MSEAAHLSAAGSGPGPDNEALRRVAARLIWWQPPEVSLTQPKRLIAQVMALGAWADVRTARDIFGEGAFRDVLQEAPPGLFDLRSWFYWHHALHLLPVPPLPRRTL